MRVSLTSVAKSGIQAVALLLVLPLAGTELVARRIVGHDVWLAFQAQFLSLFPGKSGYFLRGAYYFLILRKCPLDCCFHFGTIFTHSGTEVGRRVRTGIGCVVGLATIGDDVILAEDVHILSGNKQHGVSPSLPFSGQPGIKTCVHIGKNVWVGAGSMVLADIGSNCIIGAGSVVQRAIPDDVVALGNPARPIRKVFSDGEQSPGSNSMVEGSMA